MQVHRLQSDLDVERGTCAGLKADLSAEQTSHAQARTELKAAAEAHAASQKQSASELEASQSALRRLQEALQTEEAARAARLDEERSTGSIIEGELADARARIEGLQSQLVRMEEEATLARQETTDMTVERDTALVAAKDLKEELASVTKNADQSAQMFHAENQRIADALRQAEEAACVNLKNIP